MSKATETLVMQRAAQAHLRRRLRVGSTVYVTQRHVSRSGMLRHLSLSIIRNGHHVDITREAAEAMGETVSHMYGYPTIKVNGCGMNMHFYIVYSLARTIRPNGHRCTGDNRCPSNDHNNDWGRLTREYDAKHDGQSIDVAGRSAWIAAQPTRDKDRQHADGGYTLNHRSI